MPKRKDISYIVWTPCKGSFALAELTHHRVMAVTTGFIWKSQVLRRVKAHPSGEIIITYRLNDEYDARSRAREVSVWSIMVINIACGGIHWVRFLVPKARRKRQKGRPSRPPHCTQSWRPESRHLLGFGITTGRKVIQSQKHLPRIHRRSHTKSYIGRHAQWIPNGLQTCHQWFVRELFVQMFRDIDSKNFIVARRGRWASGVLNTYSAVATMSRAFPAFQAFKS